MTDTYRVISFLALLASHLKMEVGYLYWGLVIAGITVKSYAALVTGICANDLRATNGEINVLTASINKMKSEILTLQDKVGYACSI